MYDPVATRMIGTQPAAPLYRLRGSTYFQRTFLLHNIFKLAHWHYYISKAVYLMDFISLCIANDN